MHSWSISDLLDAPTGRGRRGIAWNEPPVTLAENIAALDIMLNAEEAKELDSALPAGQSSAIVAPLM